MTLTISGQEVLLDDADFERVKDWCLCVGGPGYVMMNRGPEHYYLHRFLLKPKSGEYVDHINFNKLDNRRCNLRVCSPHESAGNMPRRNKSTSRYRGVFPITKTGGKPWRAQLGGKAPRYLGAFWTEEEAALAYNAAAKDYFGEFACLNPVPEKTHA